jgi:hypothetical protein
VSTFEAPPGGATDALVERLFAATIDTLELASVHVGNRLGFYRALADGGDATPGELAARTGTAERYVREWLEQQAVAGFLSVDDADAEAAGRRYGLPRRPPPRVRRRGEPRPPHAARHARDGRARADGRAA